MIIPNPFLKNRLNILKSVLLILCLSLFINTSAQVGTVPVNSPTGGFRIDGYMERQGAAGDWLASPGRNEPGSYVLDNRGFPVMPIQLYQLFDAWNDKNDDIFLSGDFNDDPNTMRWTTKKASPKNDLNSASLLFRRDANNHIWVIFSGYRLKSGNSAYIDFEFSQAAIVKTGGILGGGFVSYGVHNSRIIGDVVLSMNFNTTSNNENPLTIYQWQPGSEFGDYDFFPINSDLPQGTFYSATNATEISAPGDLYGSTTYPSNTFIEFAVDLTLVLGGSSGSSDECGGYYLPFKTIWVKSKTSQSLTAKPVDFIDPFQVNLMVYELGDVFTSVNYIDLQNGQFNTTVTPGTNADYNFSWSSEGIMIDNKVDSTIHGTLNDSHISNPIFTSNPNYICYSHVWNLVVSRKSDNCLIGFSRIILPPPCDRIGKPINPDQMQQGEILNETANNNGVDELIVFPNPVKVGTTIMLKNDNTLKDIQITDISGRVVQQWTSTVSNNIEVKNLLPGMYLIRSYSRTTKKATTKKLIVTD